MEASNNEEKNRGKGNSIKDLTATKPPNVKEPRKTDPTRPDTHNGVKTNPTTDKKPGPEELKPRPERPITAKPGEKKPVGENKTGRKDEPK